MHKCLRSGFGLLTEATACARACLQKSKTQHKKQNETGCVALNCSSDTARLPVATQTRGYWKALILILLMLPTSVLAITPPGTSIDNMASATFDLGGPDIPVDSNIVTVISTIIRTPSTVTFYQYDPTGGGAVNEEVPTQYASSGPPAAGFVVSPDPVILLAGTGITVIDPNAPVSINPVVNYHTGEPVFVQLEDLDQNLDPAVQETIVVTVTASTGDLEVLILTETDVDTGVYIGYVQSTSSAVNDFDGSLTLAPESQVTSMMVPTRAQMQHWLIPLVRFSTVLMVR